MLSSLESLEKKNESSDFVGIKHQTTIKGMSVKSSLAHTYIKPDELENIFNETTLNKEYPTMSLTLKPLKRTFYGVYTGKDTPLRIQDVKKQLFETKTEPFKTEGIVVSAYPSGNVVEVGSDNAIFRFRSSIKKEEDTDLETIVPSKVSEEWDNFMNKAPTQLTNLFYDGPHEAEDRISPYPLTSTSIFKISLSWKLSVPVGNLLAIVNHPIIKSFFKRISKNDYTNHYSQNIYQFQFLPLYQRKLNTKGLHGLPRIQCSVRNTSTNVLTVFLTADSKTKMHYHPRFIEFVLGIWKTVILSVVLDSRMNMKKSVSESGYSFTSLKDGNPGLFRDSARKGGYSRKSQNHPDDRLKTKDGKSRHRYRQPVIIDWNNEEDRKVYYSLKNPGWVLESMGVCYAAMRDELENGAAIEEYNRKHPNNKIDYFNKLVMFEIYEEDYLADDAELGLLWPVCQQSKTKLSRRHLGKKFLISSTKKKLTFFCRCNEACVSKRVP